mgnify:CR=1 FL=1
MSSRSTFSSFVVGGSNAFAHAGCRAVAERPGEAYNPLFIFAGSGLGKTHLLHAIGHHLAATRPGCRIVVVSAEAFTNEFIAAIAAKEMDAFRTRYRTRCDLLLMASGRYAGLLAAQQGTLDGR